MVLSKRLSKGLHKVKILAVVLMAVLVSFDHFLKYLADIFLNNQPTIVVIPRVLHLTYVENRGAAFGILQNQRLLLVGVVGVTLAIMLYVILAEKVTNTAMIFSLSMIAGGGIGNFLDRAFRGFVIDYINAIPSLNFAVFNFADICVVLGAILFAVCFLFFDGAKNKKAPIKDE